MAALAMITGPMGKVQQKTSKSGNSYVTATVRLRENEGSVFWSVRIFDEDMQRMALGLPEGSAVCVTGPMSADLWSDKNGQTRIGFSMMADTLTTLKAKPKKPAQYDDRRPAPVKQSEPQPRSWAGDGSSYDGLDDDLPF